MANGDIAAAEAGWAPVLPSADFRLGYDDINRAADLGVRRGQRSVGTAAALAAITSPFVGMLATRSDTKITYRYNGSAWVPWDSPWVGYTPSLQNLNYGTGGSMAGEWRWESGWVHVRFWIAFGSAPSITNAVHVGVPEPIAGPSNRPTSPMLRGEVTVNDPSNGRKFVGRLQHDGPGSSSVGLFVEQVTDSFAWLTPLAQGQPIAAAQSQQIWGNVFYESNNYAF